MPYLVEKLSRDPLEVAFRYPRIDPAADFFLNYFVFIIQGVTFVGAIVTDIALLKKHYWAWFFGLGLHILVITAHMVAISLNPYYDTYGKSALIMISAFSLYLLSRKDVRGYLKPSVVSRDL